MSVVSCPSSPLFPSTSGSCGTSTKKNEKSKSQPAALFLPGLLLAQVKPLRHLEKWLEDHYSVYISSKPLTPMEREEVLKGLARGERLQSRQPHQSKSGVCICRGHVDIQMYRYVDIQMYRYVDM